MTLNSLTVHEAREVLDRKDASAVELTRSVLDQISRIDQQTRAYITVTEEAALEQAAKADRMIAEGRTAPLTGIPVAVKDIICTTGVRTTCGSKMLENFVPPYDAFVVRLLMDQGAIILGKTNTDEFAMGSSTENSAFFTSRNPWDTDRVPGGSSGGSAVAVAADEALFSLGSDTGGSIRQPAALCGVVGLKPTYGRISRYGLVAFASSLDQIGPFTKDVADCAIVMNALVAHDVNDSTSISAPAPDYREGLDAGIAGLRIGVPKEYFVEGMQPEVEEAVRAAVRTLEQQGAKVGEVSLPHTKYALPAYYLIAPAEASANLARYDGVKYGYSAPDTASMWDSYFKTRAHGFGPEVKRRIMLGTYALSTGYYDAYYLKAQKVRTLFRQDFDLAFRDFDALVTPTTPSVAFKIGEKAEDPLQMYLSDIFTIPVNLAGLPGMSIPCGMAEGMPIGLHLIGRAFDEATLLRVAYAYEQSTEWHRKKPPLAG